MSLIKFVPAVIWFIIVLVLICLPKTDLPQVDAWIYSIYPDKWVHAIMFGVMGWLFILPFHKSDWDKKRKSRLFILITCLVSVWGFITECIQLFVPGREFDLLDWGADTLGAVIVLLLIRKSVGKSQKQSL